MNSPRVDPTRENIARVYDFLLGGKDNYEVDRVFAARLVEETPVVEQLALQNRAFLIRVVRCLAQEAGLRQFVDIGSGLPTQENVHQVAQAADPDARVVYVDNDALALSHARALLTSNANTRIIAGDMNVPEEIITDPGVRELIDFEEPVGLLFVSVLHFADDADRVLRPWREVMAPGSHLVISHGEADPKIAAAAAYYREKMDVGTPRTREQIEAMFTGLELLEPGLVPVSQWRPDPVDVGEPPTLPMLGAVGRVPA